ncbi:hypothetical protein BH11PSE6_BH11PSE6_08840 [soil metagenome]
MMRRIHAAFLLAGLLLGVAPAAGQIRSGSFRTAGAGPQGTPHLVMLGGVTVDLYDKRARARPAGTPAERIFIDFPEGRVLPKGESAERCMITVSRLPPSPEPGKAWRTDWAAMLTRQIDPEDYAQGETPTAPVSLDYPGYDALGFSYDVANAATTSHPGTEFFEKIYFGRDESGAVRDYSVALWCTSRGSARALGKKVMVSALPQRTVR